MKVCKKCNIKKDFSDFHKNTNCIDGFIGTCKSCHKIYCKKYNLENKEILKFKQKIYYKNNTEKIKEYQRSYHFKNKELKIETSKKWNKNNKEKRNRYLTNRKKEDPLFKLTCNVRSLISTSFKRNGYTKKSKIYNLLGCTFDEFKLHLEKQFKDGMSWNNQGEWHLDHIYPVSLAKTEEEIIKLNHFTNFQPLWAEDNIKKGNKII
jgi:hypothetical protein